MNRNFNIILVLSILFFLIAIYSLIMNPINVYYGLIYGDYLTVIISSFWIAISIIIIYYFIKSKVFFLLRNLFCMRSLFYKNKIKSNSYSLRCVFRRHPFIYGYRIFINKSKRKIRICKNCKVIDELIDGKWTRNVVHVVGQYYDDWDDVVE